MLTLDKIYHAAFVLKNVARKTDLIKASKLSDKCELYLKTENLQETGSFKPVSYTHLDVYKRQVIVRQSVFLPSRKTYLHKNDKV